MTKKQDDTAEPRHVPPGSCSWCGHPPHGDACRHTIRLGAKRNGPCPCRHHLQETR